MDGSHMTIDVLGGPSNDDMVNNLDFNIFFASSNAFSSDYGSLKPCIHDDACLHFTQPVKLGQTQKQSTQTSASTAVLRTQRQTHLYQEQNRQESQTNTSAYAKSGQQISWDQMFALGGCNLQDGNGLDYCKDDDCVSVSCSSACEGSCPSQCGESGHAVCCDDDACGSPQLCVDEDCQEASQPCTDENCIADLPMDEQQIQTTAAITDTDKAAAAALASFVPGQRNCYLHHTHPSSPLPQDGLAGLFNFPGLPGSTPCEILSMDSVLTNMSDSHDFHNYSLPIALASHIMQYHDPSHGLAHGGSCVANDPSRLLTKCTLPRYSTEHLINVDQFLPQSPTHECGFRIQDPSEFAHHILEDHKQNLMMHAHQLGDYGSSVPEGPLGGIPPHHFQPTCGHSFKYCSVPQARQFSPPMSPLTGLSMGPSMSATPTSLPTPSHLETELSVTEAFSTAKIISPAKESQPKTSGEDEQFICRWRIGKGEDMCCRSFPSNEKLQKHCKQEHLKNLKKINGGYRCGWADCARDTCFSQRSKVERHMQVHTGYKPVQCDMCGAWLSAKQALEQHKRIHTGETPWVCQFPGCSCAFKQQSALTMHERTHTGDKPLECEICGKRFSESSNLSKHRRTHNIKGMHECRLCGKDFHRLDQLRRHMGSNHKDRPDEVSALLNEARSKSKARKIAKLKTTKSRGKDQV